MKPRAIIYTPYQTYERRYMIAAQKAGMEFHASPSLQDWSSQLFRDHEAIGILWARGGMSAAETIRRARLGNVGNLIIALIQYTGQPSFSASNRAIAHVWALSAGADDAQAMDINIEELAARLHVVGQRMRSRDQTFQFGECSYDPNTGSVTGPGGSVYLSKMKAIVLEALARYPGKVCTKYDLMSALYGGRDEPDVKIIDVFVCQLRSVLMEASGGVDFIETVWGRGYAWNPQGFRPAMAVMRKHGRQISVRSQAS